MKEGNKPLKIEWDANHGLTTLSAVDLDFTAPDLYIKKYASFNH